ncbi:rod shape-determining protein MreD [Methylobacter sp.]|uniref:rod shape-determining protein MreD n=1 Tax=Methylobacter sp. TaxID=2051955 RepID=UPI00248885D3|nr:rod shape-determining protein MreD [Methylobacter sp.]MDI1277027.1 rod shape-determining protein MreD [Methylobacter sp.]MDI1357645.1 rod shape-determining protein MreD [Methylobacter sp.]
MMNSYSGFGRIMLTIVMAMCLRIAPWPSFLSGINPDWVLLVLIYWTIAVPERIGIFHAWTVGLLTDVLTGRVFGQYALAYTLIIYFCLILHKRLRQFPLPQQGLFIFFCLLFSQILLFWLKNIQHPAQLHTSFWLPVFTGTLCWPLIYTALRRVRLSRRTK